MKDKDKGKHGQTKVDRPLYGHDEYELWWLVMLVRRAMNRARAKELGFYGVTPAEIGALFAIYNMDQNTTVTKISHWMMREPHSTSELISRMQKKGLVTKSKGLNRGNVVRVTMTEKGEQTFNQSGKKGCIHKIVSALTKEEQQHIKTYLWKLFSKSSEELGMTTLSQVNVSPQVH